MAGGRKGRTMSNWAYARAWRQRNRERNLAARRRCDNKKRFGGNRLVILERDGYACQMCSMTDAEHRQRFGRSITIDHKDGQGRTCTHPNNDLSNLWTLCCICHGKKDGLRTTRKHPLTKVCVGCGITFAPSPANRERIRYCSYACAMRNWGKVTRRTYRKAVLT